jgi:hypothetical protein
MNKVSDTTRKWLLVIHIFFASVMVGISVGILILTIILLKAQDQEIIDMAYTSMNILAKGPLRTTTIGAIFSGMIMAVLTRWGLFRYYWIIAKQLLSIIVIGIGLFGIYNWTLEGVSIAQGGASDISPGLAVNNKQLLTGAIFQIISLFSIYAISIFKPWGERRKREKAKAD